MKVLILGHVTRDLFASGRKNGGPPNYQAPVFRANGIEVLVVTSCDPSYQLQFEGCELGLVNSKESTTFEFEFMENDHLELIRSMKLINRADDLNYPTIKNYLDDYYDAVVVSPVAQEVDIDTLGLLRNHTNYLAVDIQGYSRSWDKEGHIFENISQKSFNQIVEHADLIKASHNEVSLGIIHPDLIKETSVVVTRSGADISLYLKGEMTTYKSQRVNQITDDTGAGDVFLAAYLVGKMLGDDNQAIAYADATAKRSLQIKGIPSIDQIVPIKV